MSALTLPGSIPGLLRRGSPVIYTDADAYKHAGVALDFNSGGWWICVRPPGGEERPPAWWVPPASLALDISDATGRAHAAWWLRDVGDPDCFIGGPNRMARERAISRMYHRYAEGKLRPTCSLMHFSWAGVSIEVAHALYDGEAEYHRPTHGYYLVPEVEGLRTNDPRTLPDGSRWVDAEALRRVVIHLAGLPVPA